MELKVEVEGIERSVSGIDENTTCAQIIYALAHATAQKGRFAMIEKFRNMERRLSPNDKPLEMLAKWGEHSSNVTFSVKRVDSEGKFITGPEDTHSTPTTSHGLRPYQQRSTSSLPAYTLHDLSSRPPPPDYRQVMDQRFSSQGRQPEPRAGIPFLYQDAISISKMGLSDNDLRSLIETQRGELNRLQTLELQLSENSKQSEAELELLQLMRQQCNLHSVLQRLRSANWPQQYQLEVKRSHRLRASIEATLEAIDKAKRDLDVTTEQEAELIFQISKLMEAEQNDSLSVVSSNPSDNVKLRAC